MGVGLMGTFEQAAVSTRRPWGVLRRWGVVAAVIALLASAFAVAGFAATTTKPYAINITPHSVAAGSTTTFNAAITNEASPQYPGSANITAPTGFTITGAAVVAPATGTATVVGNVVQVRNLVFLPAGANVANIAIKATAPCSAPVGGSHWSIIAKQDNNFSGPPGNTFTLDSKNSDLSIGVTGAGGCQLKFLTEPADAQVNKNITSVTGNPAGTPVQVEVLDASGNLVTSSTAPITITINSGGASTNLVGAPITQSAVGGIASFSNLVINTHGNYTLIAQSDGISPAISNLAEADKFFTIWDDMQACTGGVSCSTPLLGNANYYQTQFSGTSTNGGFLLLTLGQDSLDPNKSICTSNFNYAPLVATGGTSGFSTNLTKQVIGIVDKSVDQAQPNNGVSFYRVCFESDDFDFTYPGYSGVLPQYPKGTPFILPDCKTVAGTAPCTKSITKTNAGDVIETITLPKDDYYHFK
jgi:hypothetical protein